MAIKAKYVHTNIIADDWRSLADFYQTVFGCTPIPPERDFRGRDVEAGTGLLGVHLQGIHLLLPGYESNEPTLEIFSYNPKGPTGKKAVNRPGLAHIAFQVEDVIAAHAIVLAAGGQKIGDVVTMKIATGAKVTWCYLTDPEGNIIELQSWEDR